MAHANLGTALGGKGDWEGQISEEREALRLNPDNAMAHYALGIALEQKDDRQGALEEFRAASILDPKDVLYKQAYERLLHRMNK
jgi:Flp pilus assembly protein TadD